MRELACAALAATIGACQGASYAPRSEGCPVKSYVATPDIPVDDLGDVSVDCAGVPKCARLLMDEVCKKGGDVLWGLGDNAVTSTTMRGHAAHASRTTYAPRGEGCEVKVYGTNPTVPTENIGRVSASCGLDVSDADCLRKLEDQVCTLGGDVVWGVAPPLVEDAKKKLAGRAAHTK
jgi:hypothetical protein